MNAHEIPCSVPTTPYSEQRQVQLPSCALPLGTEYDNGVPFSPRHRDRGGDQVDQREWQQKLPSKGHELVVAEAWQHAAHPDIKKEEDENLGGEPEHRQDGLQNAGPEQRPVPAAQK